ncbi:MAG: UMP kinase [Candidatus Bathyarchaeota archaeon]|nr:UMP kinase [Candidatus Bathyarchaeota archaeon]
MKIILKLGGFLFPKELNFDLIQAYAELLKKLYSEDHQLIVVTGGGKGAREYISTAREMGASETICDEIGIEYTRLNSRLLISAIPEEAFPDVPQNIQQINNSLRFNKIIVMGGLQPGQSTNAVAALAAELIRADMFINATDVDGIYEDDPKTNTDAKMYDEIKIMDLFDMITKKRSIAGSYKLFDLVAVNLIARSKITTWFVNGKDPKNIENIIHGKHIGTRIIFG